jgi:hypothetical protein
VSDLQSSFQSLLGALGVGSDSEATLGSFLKALANNLPGGSVSGIAVNVQA